MVGIQIRASEGLALTGVGGIALLGNLLERHTDFRTSFTTAFTKRRDGIPWGDVLLTYVASLATGKSDFEAIPPATQCVAGDLRSPLARENLGGQGAAHLDRGLAGNRAAAP